MKFNIGTKNFGYNQKRNFLDCAARKNVQFIKEKDVFSYGLHLYFKLKKKVHPFYQFLHLKVGNNKVDFRHFFNAISFNKKPWVVTFETKIPRLGNTPRFWQNLAIKKLASPNCHKIIALSDCAYQIQVDYVNKHYPNLAGTIIKKMTVLHPPQELLLRNYQEKNISEENLIFTVVGAEFFRKGGREILNVFDRVITKKPNVILNIVGELKYGDYATKSTLEDYNRAKEIINNHPNNIKHYKNLANEKVLDLLKSTHVGLLPTWGDSYGYSILEAQAAGCPVISTNIRALPEINNEEIGWIIEVPKTKEGDADVGDLEAQKKFQVIVEGALSEILWDIIGNPGIIKIKGEKALDKIKTFHNPERHSDVLMQIYEEIFKSGKR